MGASARVAANIIRILNLFGQPGKLYTSCGRQNIKCNYRANARSVEKNLSNGQFAAPRLTTGGHLTRERQSLDKRKKLKA